ADDGPDRVFWRRRKLADDQITTALIHSDEIGESTAGVNSTANLWPFSRAASRRGRHGRFTASFIFALLGRRAQQMCVWLADLFHDPLRIALTDYADKALDQKPIFSMN